MNPSSPAEDVNNPSPHIPPGPKKDYSLKDDQTFTISIPGRGSKSESGSNLLGLGGSASGSLNKGSATEGGAVPLLPPPPSTSVPKRR
jgi:adaptin ear-binding coat-associated protein 1/2